MESSAVLPAICIVVVLVIEFRHAATDRPDSQRAGAAIRPGTPGPCSRALRATPSRVGPEENSLRFIEDTSLPSNYANLTVPNKQTNYCIILGEFRVTTLFHGCVVLACDKRVASPSRLSSIIVAITFIVSSVGTSVLRETSRQREEAKIARKK